MKRNELKNVLKPLIKECIKEVIFEEGTLSGIITEVVQGLQGTTRQPIVEKKIIRSNEPSQAVLEARQSLEETKQNLQNSTGLKGIFKGTVPLRSGGGSKNSQHGALRDLDPSDPGVDISSILGDASKIWRAIK